jgi:hypothetical protein
MQVGEIAPATARHKDFLADLIRAFEYDNTTATSACRDRTHKTRGSTAQDNYVIIVHGSNISGAAAKWRALS